MKITFKETYIFNVNISSEKRRIRRIFKTNSEAKKAHLEILTALQNKNWGQMITLYNNLPEIEGYPGQEYMGMWFWNIRDKNTSTWNRIISFE